MSCEEKVNSLKDLLKYMEIDKQKNGLSYKRFPVRLIFLNNLWTIKELVKELTKQGIKLLDITTLPPFDRNPDSFLTSGSIVRCIENAMDDIIIVSLSELLRFYSDDQFSLIMRSLLEIENSYNNLGRRVYIPLVGLKTRFESVFWKDYYRRDEWIPYWELNDPQEKIHLIFVNFKSPYLKGNLIKNSKELFDLWKAPPSDKFLCTSKLLNKKYHNATSDEFYIFKGVKNQKEYISEILNVDIGKMEYHEEEKDLWDELLKGLVEENINNFIDFVRKKLKILDPYDLNQEDLCELYLKSNTFKKWLIKNYVLFFSKLKNHYIYRVFESLEDYKISTFIRTCWFKIFDMKNVIPSIFRERLSLLNKIHIDLKKAVSIDIEEEINKKIKDLPIDVIPDYLTGITKTEKTWIIKNLEKIKGNLNQLYRELSYYLKDFYLKNGNTETSWIIDYFKEYKSSKLKNQISNKLKNMLEEKNRNSSTFFRWYYSFKPAKEIIEELGISKKYWIDGLGIEFVSLVSCILEDYGYEVEIYIARSNLPSSTRFNSFEKVSKFENLDHFIHSKNFYEYPEDIVEELSKIKEVLESIGNINRDFLIISDHGLTVFANFNFQKFKKYSFSNVHHEGRYAEINNNVQFLEDEDFLIYSDDTTKKKFLIALKYSSLSKIPRREVHGGATPEEVLVPIIFAKIRSSGYKINILSNIISIRKPVVKIRIEPKPASLPRVFVYEKELKVIENDGVYEVKLKNLRTGTHYLKIVVSGVKREFKIQIKGGMEEKEIL